MREGSRGKEKIEVTLDTRQLVSIVLGSAVLLGIVFYLGVTVGKELGIPELVLEGDPLERLDRQAAAAEPLTFPDALTREEPAVGGSQHAAGAREPAREPAPAAAAGRQAPSGAEPAAQAQVARKDVAPDAGAPASGDAGEAAAAPKQAKAPLDLSSALARGAAKEKSEAAPPGGAAPARSEKPSLDVSAALAKVDALEQQARVASTAPQPSQGAGGFTVQVAALPNQREADALAKRLGEQGFPASVTVAEIPGRGTFYRVRVGRFGSRDEAVRYLEDLRNRTRLDGFVASLEGG